MSHLRAPAARADRREGGRHGRPAARAVPALPETHIRPQLLRLAVLPPVAVALSACAAVLFTVRSTEARPSLTLWCVLAGAVGVTCTGILIAAVAADRAARSVSDRIGALRRASARGEADLRALVEALRRGEAAPPRTPRGGPPEDADDFELLAADLTRAHDGAVTAVVQAAQLSSQAGSEQKLEVFLNLARRLQSLVHREISILDELENEIEDPDLLKGLFHVDHLATRIRRHAENLAVLGGAVSRRQWSNPVSMTEVLRSAIAEVEQYSRVKLVPPVDGELRGHAVADVIHLLAELVENATVFSAPHTQVLLRANLVTSGLAVEVEDRGLGMPVGEQARMNALLADPDQVNVASLLADGRIGLFVVSQLAKRHGIHVRLQTNIYGGVQAVLVVPQALLGSVPGAPGAVPQPPSPVPRTAGPGGAPGQQQARPGAEAGHRAAPPAPPSPPPTASSRPSSPRTSPPGVTSPGGTASVNGGPVGGGPVGGGGAANGRSGSGGGGGPAPLPVRGAREERPTPAAAPPGIRPDDRHRVTEHTAAPPTPRAGTVRGTMGKPQLPRRRAQEHIVPQLRDAPAPRPESEHLAGHDPGLMAAFQRGIGLAETQQHLEATSGESSPSTGADHLGPAHTESGHRGTADSEPTHVASGYLEPGHMEPGHMESRHMESRPVESSGHPGVVHTGSVHTGATHSDPPRLMDVRHVDLPLGLPSDVRPIDRTRIPDTHLPHPPASPEARGVRDSGAVPRLDLDHTTRHDGSAPAG
ncbi:membrane protein [Streptomyces lincolnensis]|uniref:histidine kinase n=1 Tax=Streptomyces lincolnensis TaxID=1915 RepID=A0A1B1MM26_STRLN|nr:ATP-binding protein [Streptomyces lincolnensis]ANS69442.1 membrane protein [Streptomyces lincolnensis]AXG58361.1 membrane protein [Streptomyces lincolnensis]QMV11015.1 ATP-binding protein [Streptomyces lincolnensis]